MQTSRFVLALALSFPIPLVACLTPAQQAAAEQAGITLGIEAGECVLTQAINGVSDATAIAKTCGLAAGANVLSIVATLISELLAPPDAGTAVASMAQRLAPSIPRAQILAALRAAH